MKIEELLSPAETMVGQKPSDKARLIQDIATRAALSLGLDASQIAQELQRREELGSTGMGNGIAIPHARMPQIKQPFGLLWRLKRPIEFEAIDGQPVDLVFTLLQPATAPGEQLNALACVARKLREPERLEKLRLVDDGPALYREITR